jgi:hypothetical protein
MIALGGWINLQHWRAGVHVARRAAFPNHMGDRAERPARGVRPIQFALPPHIPWGEVGWDHPILYFIKPTLTNSNQDSQFGGLCP